MNQNLVDADALAMTSEYLGTVIKDLPPQPKRRGVFHRIIASLAVPVIAWITAISIEVLNERSRREARLR